MRGGAWALFGKVATALVGLVLTGLLARLLMPAEMGLYFLAFNLATFFSLLGRAGLENTLLRFVAQANGLADHARLRGVLEKGWVLSRIAAVSAGLLAATVTPWLGERVFETPGLTAVGWLIGAWAALLAVQFVSAEVFRGFQEIGHSVWFGGLITGVITLTMLGVAQLVDVALGLKQVLLLIVLALLVNNLGAFMHQHRKLSVLPNKKADTASYRELLSHSWPLLINSLTLFLLSQSDIWILGAYAEEQEIAIYGAASRLAMLTSMSLAVVNMVVPPLIARMHVQNDVARLEKLLRTVATLAAIPSLAVLGAFMFFAAPIMELIYGAYYRTGATVLLILCAGQVVNVLTGSCGYVLMMTGHQKLIMIISLASAMLAMITGIVFVRWNGIDGLALAYAIATIIQQISMWILVKTKIGIWTHTTVSITTKILREKI